MASSTKILTVSYGTFSCTAEGFEDPLGVVKDTTQFFRAVVREDRFFGAEPPQLDPDLATEVFRDQMSADHGDGTLTLRGPVGEASAGALTAALAAGPSVARAAEPVPADPSPADTVPEQDVLDALIAEAQTDIEQAEVAPEAAPVVEEADEDLSDEIDLSVLTAPVKDIRATKADALSDLMDEDDGSDIDEDVLQDILDDEDDDDDDALFDAAELAADEEDAPGADVMAAAKPAPAIGDPSSVAAKLRRIRAVVSNDETQQREPEAFFNEDEHAEDTQEADADALEDMLGGFGADAPIVAEDLEDDLDDDEDNLFADGLSDLMSDDEDEDDEDAFDDRPVAQAAPSNIAQEEDALDDKFFDDALYDDDDEDYEDDYEDAPSEVSKEPSKSLAPPPRARVVKVKREVFEEAVASGALEAVDDDDMDRDDSSLSDDDEADLARELEAVKAELAADLDDDGWDDDDDMPDPEPFRLDNPIAQKGDDLDALDRTAARLQAESSGEADYDPAEDVRKAVKMASPARAMLTEDPVDDKAEDRLMEETDSQFDEPEGNRRRSAIAHLRAAVAATKADRLLGRKPDAEQQEPYREDLSSVVRPRRPQGGEARTERPEVEPARTAPLKLVAEQRIEKGEEDQEMDFKPVRPRRVARVEETVEEDTAVEGGFVDYAEAVGARDLPELLEAAAAYMSFVEGREQFSRPQLMSTVRQAEVEESSREDRLRTFGQLLREGKIEKTRGGRFTASDLISFKPDRAVG